MNLFKSLAAIFNRPQTVSIPRRELAELVAPFVPRGSDPTNAALREGLSEAAEWLRIGFDHEKDKGALYHALHYSLERIRDAAEKADPQAPTIETKREYLEAIKTSYTQLVEAARHLTFLDERRKLHILANDKFGNTLAVPVLPIWNRPGEDYAEKARKLGEIEQKFETFFERHKVREASTGALMQYIPVKRY